MKIYHHEILVLFFVFLINIIPVHAQLKATAVCPPFEVDLLTGYVNKMSTKATLGEMQKAFPCPGELVEDDGTGSKCVGLFFRDKGISFITGRNYFEINENFKGKINPPLMGANRSDLFKTLGYPKIKDISWDAFGTEYGCMVLYYNKAGKINKIQFSTKGTETLKLCE